MNNAGKYRKIFSRLCHIVALKQNSSLTSAIDGLLQTTFAYDLDFAPDSVDEVVDAASVYFGVELSGQDVELSLQRLLDVGHIIMRDHTYALSSHALDQQDSKIERSNKLEEVVKSEWFQVLKVLDGFDSVEQRYSLWACLMSYMARAFYSHGVQTIQLLDPTVPSDTVDTAGLESYFREAKDEHCGDMSDELVEAALERFFTFKSRAKTRSTVQLLDSTFTYFALTADADVARYLTDTIPPVKIFVDSNFIFGLLSLHENPLNQVSKDLVKCTFDNGIPFTFLYTDETLQEIERSLEYYGERLRGVLWTRETSRRAQRSRFISGIEQRFHQLNAESPRNADLLLTQFEALPELLTSMGFSLYDATSLINDQEQIDLYHEYDSYLKRRGRSKRYEVINHDVFLWRTVQESRTGRGRGLSAGAFLMTVDYSLALFDRRKRYNDTEVASTIFPNQLFQLLRPFIATSEDVDDQFVETFALPEFRAAKDDYGDVASLALKVINSYSEVSDEFASKILTDTITLEQFKAIGPDLAKVEQFVSNELARENSRLQAEKTQLETRTASVRLETETIKQQSKERETQLLQQVAEQVERETYDKQTIHDLRAESASMREEKDRKRKLKDSVYKAIAFEFGALILAGLAVHTVLSKWYISHPNQVGLFVTGTLAIGISTARIAFGHRWDWFASHPRKVGLQLSAGLILAGLLVALADPSNIQLGFGGMFVGGLVALVSKVD